MRISNGIRKIENGTIITANAIKPKASWLLRKTAMTAIAVVLVPVGTAADMLVAGGNGIAHGAAASLKAKVVGSPLAPLTKAALGNGYSLTVSASMSVNDVDALHGKRVRLVEAE